MLEAHHRAVYVAHNQLAQFNGGRRVYYVVSRLQSDPNKFVVVGITCAPNAPKRDLAPLMTHSRCEEEVQIFTARGNCIERSRDGKGRYIDDAAKDLQHVSLAPVALAA